MSETKPFASLSPTLLARKGAARPAMRPQLAPLGGAALSRQLEDLGWNDMGHDEPAPITAPKPELVSISESASPAAEAPVPEVVKQRVEAARRVGAQRQSALSNGRRAAFTLRLDAERHLKLRLACTLCNRSAQQLVTEAVDRLLDDLSEVADLAAQIARADN